MEEKKKKLKGISRETIRNGHAALIILVSFVQPIYLIKDVSFDTCILSHVEVIFKVSLAVGTLVFGCPYYKTFRSSASSNHIFKCLPYITLEYYKPTFCFLCVCPESRF